MSSPAGLTALIETQETVMAAVGGEARLNCLLMQPRDVLQVTWQKPLTEGEKTVATYNKHFGQLLPPARTSTDRAKSNSTALLALAGNL